MISTRRVRARYAAVLAAAGVAAVAAGSALAASAAGNDTKADYTPFDRFTPLPASAACGAPAARGATILLMAKRRRSATSSASPPWRPR